MYESNKNYTFKETSVGRDKAITNQTRNVNIYSYPSIQSYNYQSLFKSKNDCDKKCFTKTTSIDEKTSLNFFSTNAEKSRQKAVRILGTLKSYEKSRTGTERLSLNTRNTSYKIDKNESISMKKVDQEYTKIFQKNLYYDLGLTQQFENPVKSNNKVVKIKPKSIDPSNYIHTKIDKAKNIIYFLKSIVDYSYSKITIDKLNIVKDVVEKIKSKDQSKKILKKKEFNPENFYITCDKIKKFSKSCTIKGRKLVC